MRILHYGLGYPPNRSGGLVYYTIDLMTEQVNQGHKVGYLYPSKVRLFNKKVYIKKQRNKIKNVTSFELINSLPLPLFGGIKTPTDFMKSVGEDVFLLFLNNFKPDVIHVHSLMGIHKEFFEVAKKLRIRMVFTSHDYFGLSPNPTFYFNDESWDQKNTLKFWLNVSDYAMKTKKLRLFQLSFYSTLKNFYKRFSKVHLNYKNDIKIKPTETYPLSLRNSFEELREYYIDIFGLIDNFHFNSTLAQGVFKRNLNKIELSGQVIPVSNSSILGGEKKINIDFGSIKKITYIGPYSQFKGFNVFLDLAKQFKNEDIEFEIYGEDVNIFLPENVTNKGRFFQADRPKIFESIELLIVPSLCKETFGFLVLEALSFGTPVLMSSNVGACDLLDSDMIFDSVANIVKKIRMRENITFETYIYSMREHALQIEKMYNLFF